jgi:hypothetical protein
VRKLLIGILFALSLASAPNARAQTLSADDRTRALQYLESTRKNLVEATQGLSEAQWNFKPSPFRWSIAQVMEHIATSEDFLRGITENQVLKAPAISDRDIKQTDERVLTMIPDRSFKVAAPAPLRPNNRYNTPDAALKHFLESRDKTIDLLKTNSELRAHAVDNAALGKVDGYQFILLIAAHSERHTKQLNEVKADPKFPKQ